MAKALDLACDAAALATLIIVTMLAYCVLSPSDFPMHVSEIHAPSFGTMTGLTRKHEARIQEIQQ